MVQNYDENMGTRTTVKHLKELYGLYAKFACKQPCNVADMTLLTRKGRGGMPRSTSLFTKYIQLGNTLTKKYILSLLRVYEVIELAPVVDISTVITDTGGREGYITFQNDFKSFLRTNPLIGLMKKTFLKELSDLGAMDKGKIPFHTTTKSGTEGPALANVHQQSLAINGEVKELLCSLSNRVYSEDLRPLIDFNQSIASKMKDDIFPVKTKTGKATSSLGRICFISDKGGKTRMVAIGNYWIQNTLLPYHKALYSVLRDLSQDGTFRQTQLFDQLCDLSKEFPIKATDLTAATDMFPLEIQRDVLEFFDEEIGKNWFSLFRNIEFDHEKTQVKYGTGGPMGIYSNWAMFAVTHHALVLYCFSNTNNWDLKGRYGIIGDDIAIANEAVAMDYERCIQLMKVKVNKTKSWIPQPNSLASFEFAKRYATGGEEMTALPPGLIKSGYDSYWNIPEIVSFLVKHNYLNVLETPLSRILHAFGVKPWMYEGMFVAFYISHLLGAAYQVTDKDMADLSVNVDVSGITPGFLLELRQERLIENILETASSKKTVATNTQALLSRLGMGTVDVSSLALSRVFDTQHINLALMQRKMMMIIYQRAVLLGDEALTIPKEIEMVRSIEYLTPVTFEDLQKGITHREDSIHNRGKVLRKLVKRSLESGVLPS